MKMQVLLALDVDEEAFHGDPEEAVYELIQDVIFDLDDIELSNVKIVSR